MFMKSKALLIIMALGAFLAIGLFATGCGGGDKSDLPANVATAESNDDNDANPPKSDTDTEMFRKVAVKACVDSAADEDVPEDMAQEYCDCAIDELLKSVSQDEFAEIGANALSGDTSLPPEIEDKMADAILECLDRLVTE
jgi:hypothetical protein